MNENFNNLLRFAIEKNDLPQVRYLLNQGADLESVVSIHQLEEFLEKCKDPVASYLSYYSASSDVNRNCLGDIVSELDWGIFDRRTYAKRNPTHFYEEKTDVWSVGLLEGEALMPQYLSSLHTICDIAPWVDRLMNINLDTTEEFIVSSLQYVGLHKASMSDFDMLPYVDVLSPNISHLFKVRIFYREEFKKFLAEHAWFSREQLVGIGPVEEHTLFKRSNHWIDSKIFDRMKLEVTRMHQLIYNP
jgi:hypothetical protein